MITIGITYNPEKELFNSGLNQAAICLAELFLELDYHILFLHPNSDSTWFHNFPPFSSEKVTISNLYETKNIDLLIDIDGLLLPEYRKKIAKKTIVFMRTFLQFTEMDKSVYIEVPYQKRSMENIDQIWCWDILNPEETIPSIQTLFPCPIYRIPFIFSTTICNFFTKNQTALFDAEQKEWSVHISEKNTNESSCVLPLVAIRYLSLKNIIKATYHIHNSNTIKENKFFKENILINIDSDKLPITFVDKEPYYEYIKKPNQIFFSHSRFINLRTSLFYLLWMGIPVIHNSPVLASLHPLLNKMYYKGNWISQIAEVFSNFQSNPMEWYSSIKEIQYTISSQFSIQSRKQEWITKLYTYLNINNTTNVIIDITNNTVGNIDKECESGILVGFSDMWEGFCYDRNFIIDAICNELPNCKVNGVLYEEDNEKSKPDVLIIGPYGEKWKVIDKNLPKIYFSAENWKNPEDPSIKLYLTSSREEDNTHLRIPTWATFIDWFSNSKEFPKQSDENPIRIPLHFVMTPHPIPFTERTDFCGFVVSNPICNFRNQAFILLNGYKKVNSGGTLFNNIGGQLYLKYPGGGSGDISKYEFFKKHKFTISFENSQAPGYITEKVLHSKIAGCVPIYWGDADTQSDFVPYSFINVSTATDPYQVINIIKKIELNPDFCSKIASTPLLDEERKNKILTIISNMATKIIKIASKDKLLSQKSKSESPQNVHTEQVESPLQNEQIVHKEQVESPPQNEHKEQVESSPQNEQNDHKEQVENKKTEWDGIDKIFIINLDRRRDRWNKLMEEEPHLNNDKLTRVSAVDGQTLTLTKPIYDLFSKNSFEWKKGVIGCNLSHLQVWMKILKETGNYFLILEDDVRFDKEKMKLWNEAFSCIPEDADLLYLGGVLPPNKKVLSQASLSVNEYWSEIIPNYFFSSIPLPIFHFCAYSYILTKSGVQKIMNHIIKSDNKYFTISDQLLGHHQLNLKKYFIQPFLANCFQENDPNYILSDFNKLQREASYDSDLWSNTDHFTEEEVDRFRTKSDASKIIVYHWSESNDVFHLYEQKWLEDMFNKELQLTSLTREDVPDRWYLVQRPFVKQWNEYFMELDKKNCSFKVLHLSDEFGVDDISFYSLPNCKGVIRNYYYSHLPNLPHIITIPLGYHHSSIPKQIEKKWKERELVWSFHGTNWFERDKELELFTTCVPHHCKLQPSWNHTTQSKENEYLSTLSNSKFCPILKGNNVETFRLYEALESGALPVTTINDSTYIKWVEENMKLSSLYDWTNAKEVMSKMEISEEIYNEVMKRWKEWKEKTKKQCSVL